jgi:hypothetical protein
MFDRTFAPLLTFTMLIAATLSIGIAMVEEGRGSTAQQASADIITMPTVTITGKRVQSVAEATQALRTTME